MPARAFTHALWPRAVISAPAMILERLVEKTQPPGVGVAAIPTPLLTCCVENHQSVNCKERLNGVDVHTCAPRYRLPPKPRAMKLQEREERKQARQAGARRVVCCCFCARILAQTKCVSGVQSEDETSAAGVTNLCTRVVIKGHLTLRGSH
jgi:hypothetical protein